MPDFVGRVLIVTGGARGIGAETARRYARLGGQVLVCDILEVEGTTLCAEIGEAAAFLRVDVTDPEQCQSAVNEAAVRFGRVDFLVNAAVRILPGRLEALSPNDWKAALDVGLTGSFLMSQAVGRALIAAGNGGAIVNLSSVGARHPYGMTGAYSTLKAAVIMLSRHLAIEWAEHGIRVNCVCPGHTETPLTAYMRDPAVKRARRHHAARPGWSARGHRRGDTLPAFRRCQLCYCGDARHRWRTFVEPDEPYARAQVGLSRRAIPAWSMRRGSENR